MLRCLFLLFFLLAFANAWAQENTDSVRLLNEVTVKAYASDRPLAEVPASVVVLKEQELNRFNNTSLLPVVNTVPGVRMEERSPGSYRFSIRGSSLRSPFGVRNVKFYWNGLPLTDGGGNTYLNLIDFNAISSMEIIKGPGASLYGAGTGGVVLLHSPESKTTSVNYSVMMGSFGLFRVHGGGTIFHTKKFSLDILFAYQKANGYRQQTEMKRLATQINWRNTIGKKGSLKGTLLTPTLTYQTPGGLTLAQYEQDPQQARPATATLPGAVEQHASVGNGTGYLGLVYEHEWSPSWSARIGAYNGYTQFVNKAIRNFEERTEINWGGRADVQYKFETSSIKGKVTVGSEYQGFVSPVKVHDNNLGTKGNLQTDDELQSQFLVTFAQVEVDLPKNFYATLGASGNFVRYEFLRSSLSPAVSQSRNFDPVISPRIALLKKITPLISVYTSVSSGFSPPTLAEVRPSTNTFNNLLNAERGTSYEAGMKATLFRSFSAEVALYDFRLNETIVIQRDAAGADFFVNAGKTSQRGAEIFLAWSPTIGKKLTSTRFWTSYTYNRYRFDEYVNDGKDYSGNALTGVPPTVLVVGADIRWKNRLYVNLTGNYVDRLPLNDANTDFASDYFLLGARAGYTFHTKIPVEFFAGIDNALDQRYSLGNDLNAAGGRYYNAAAPQNYYTGLNVKLEFPAKN